MKSSLNVIQKVTSDHKNELGFSHWPPLEKDQDLNDLSCWHLIFHN